MDLFAKLLFLLMIFITTNSQLLYHIEQKYDDPSREFSSHSKEDNIGLRRKYSYNSPKKLKFEEYDKSSAYDDDLYDDDHSFTVGAKIAVGNANKNKKQKHNFNTNKATSYTNFHISHDEDEQPKRRPQSSSRRKIAKKPVFQPSSSSNYDDDDHEEFSSSEYPSGIHYPKALKSLKLENIENLYPTEKKFKNVASKGQIAKYMEDQQKILEEAVQLQLLNDPSSNYRGRYKQYLKSKDEEKREKEYEDDLRYRQDSYYVPNSNEYRSKRRPDRKNSPRKTSVFLSPSQKGLGNYRAPKIPTQSLRFELDI